MQRAAYRGGGFAGRAEEVAEGLQLPRERDGIEDAGLPAERELAERGIDVNRERAGLAREELPRCQAAD